MLGIIVDIVNLMEYVVLSLNKCLKCGKEISSKRKYCSLECYRSSFELIKRITKLAKKSAESRKGKTLEEIYGIEKAIYLRKTQYKKCAESHKKFKGKTLEEIYGPERAKEIKFKGHTTRTKGKYKDKLDHAEKTTLILPIKNPTQKGMTKGSKGHKAYKIHEKKVSDLYESLRSQNFKVLNASSWVKDCIPDLILLKDGKLIAIELEHITQSDSVCARARRIKTKELKQEKIGFFDEIKIVFSFDDTNVETLLKQLKIK